MAKPNTENKKWKDKKSPSENKNANEFIPVAPQNNTTSNTA